MDITKMKFKTITYEEIIEKRGSKPFITLNHNSIYLPKVISTIIKEKNYKYVMVRTSESVISMEFLIHKSEGAFEITLNENRHSGIIYGIIGSTALSEKIAKEFDIFLDKNRYYKSVDSEIRDNIMYFEFNKKMCCFRKGTK